MMLKQCLEQWEVQQEEAQGLCSQIGDVSSRTDPWSPMLGGGKAAEGEFLLMGFEAPGWER